MRPRRKQGVSAAGGPLMRASAASARRAWFVVTLAVGVLGLGLCAETALAAAPASRLALHVLAAPTHLSSRDNAPCEMEVNGGISPPPCDTYQVTVTNTGARNAAGPITVSDRLPAGVSPETVMGGVTLFLARNQTLLSESEPSTGEPAPASSCTASGPPETVTCTYEGELEPDQRLELQLLVTVEPTARPALNVATVAEAGTTVATSEAQDNLEEGVPPFGPSFLAASITGRDGAPDVQAGGHPYEFVTRFDVNTKFGQQPETGKLAPVGVDAGVRDAAVNLPLGFLGSATATPRCTIGQLTSQHQCPPDTMVGHLTSEPDCNAGPCVNSPLFNLVPEHGVAAELGFLDSIHGSHVIEASLAPTPTGYVLRAVAGEVSQIVFWNVITTLWGNPAERNGGGITPTAMFTNSSDCSGEPQISTRVHGFLGTPRDVQRAMERRIWKAPTPRLKGGRRRRVRRRR